MIVVVPNVLRDAINDAIDRALAGRPALANGGRP